MFQSARLKAIVRCESIFYELPLYCARVTQSPIASLTAVILTSTGGPPLIFNPNKVD